MLWGTALKAVAHSRDAKRLLSPQTRSEDQSTDNKNQTRSGQDPDNNVYAYERESVYGSKADTHLSLRYVNGNSKR